MYYRLLTILCLCLLAVGCATKAKTTFTDADGTSFNAVSKAGPFGTLDTTNQNLGYTWNATDGTIAVGQVAKGLDNTGQIAALNVVGDTIGKVTGQVITGLIQSGILVPNPNSDGSSGTVAGTSGSRIEQLQSQVEALRTLVETLRRP